jgi:ppGpp synthetase/RelA/SpoT-type nucleotidyltranferase
MPLPVSKSALDRPGVRLVSGDSISDDDLVDLARIVDAYQDVLNRVKLRLTELGFSATARIKTTGTLVDKLRRETARFSQVQDLAGARIVVPDRAAQDDATSRIANAFEAAGCTCKVIDRRQHPSHGYRAVHIVLQVDKVPVEIQVRTDLQDSWAQLVERLADIWGRGIRYGDEPDAPDSLVEGLTSRRDAVSLLMQLSDAVAEVEEQRASLMKTAEELTQTLTAADALAGAGGRGGDWIIDDTIPGELLASMDQTMADLKSELIPLFTGWRRMTGAQFADALRSGYQLARQDHDRREAELGRVELRLRDILGKLAAAIGQE